MYMKLKNKVAIITGGSTGIGYAISEAYIEEGAKVAICGLTLESAISAGKNIIKKHPQAEILAIKVDVSNTNEVIEMVKKVINKWQKIDILINNAGICQTKPIIDMSDEDYETVMNVNATGTFRCIREVTKYMKEYGGSIINTSSMVGLYGGAYQTAYATSKYAINGITKCCAKELGQYKIRVNAVAPGVIETDMVKDNVTKEVKDKLTMMTPLRKTGNPEDLKGIYVYLASEEANFTTGTIISVDGGLVM